MPNFKYTKHFLKKLEGLMETVGYTIRYEKGNFQSGYCMVEDRNMAVVNKFFDTEARINCLIDILQNVSFDEETLPEKERKLWLLIAKGEGEDEDIEEESTESVVQEDSISE